MSVVFDFNTSINAFSTVYPMLLSVDLLRMKNGGLLVDGIYGVFLFVFTTKIELSECCV